MVKENAGDLLVAHVAYTFAFHGHDEGLGRVLVQKREVDLEEVVEGPLACQGHWEDGVHKDELGGSGRLRLDANVKEADAVLELCARIHGLTPYGGKGFVVGWRVVSAGNGEGTQGCFILHVFHPAVELGATVDCEKCILRQKHTGEFMFWLW